MDLRESDQRPGFAPAGDISELPQPPFGDRFMQRAHGRPAVSAILDGSVFPRYRPVEGAGLRTSARQLRGKSK